MPSAIEDRIGRIAQTEDIQASALEYKNNH